MTSESRKILVADDEADVLQFIKAVLEDDGYAFVTTQDGQWAVELARSEKPDLVILDVQMPSKTGFEVFAELRGDEATKSIPVIMLTAVAQRTGLAFNAKDMEAYFGSEPDAFIDKPVDPVKLRETVASLIA